MVLYLGYFALVLIGIYFTFGFLKISGEGLASLGYENNYIIEGMTDKDQEKRLEKFDKNIAQVLKKKQKELDKLEEDIDIDEYKEKLEELQGIEKEIFKKSFYSILVKSKDFIKSVDNSSSPLTFTLWIISLTSFSLVFSSRFLFLDSKSDFLTGDLECVLS